MLAAENTTAVVAHTIQLLLHEARALLWSEPLKDASESKSEEGTGKCFATFNSTGQPTNGNAGPILETSSPLVLCSDISQQLNYKEPSTVNLFEFFDKELCSKLISGEVC